MISASTLSDVNLVSDLQGNILEAHGRHYAVHLFLSFGVKYNSQNVRAWIRRLSSRITSAAQESTIGRSGNFFSFLLTHAGYVWLDKVPPPDVAFTAGMKNRGAVLLDPPVSEWENGYQKVIHALLILASHDAVSLAQESVRIKVSALNAGLSVITEEPGYRLLRGGDDIEHFGHVDGISQPKVKALLNTTEQEVFIDDPAVVLVREPVSRDGFGSFLVFRKLEQNVALWQSSIKRLAAKLGAHPDSVAALVVGRFPDGTPVLSHDQTLSAPLLGNDFNYQKDPSGNVCPLHAHIRKTNPRTHIKRFPQIVRRGMSYGVRLDLHPTAQNLPLPSKGVGLLFMCYQKDIQNQFEFIQQVANDNNLPQLGSGADPLIGQGPLKPNLWPSKRNSPDRIECDFDRTVTLKGGEYFFAPSISFVSKV